VSGAVESAELRRFRPYPQYKDSGVDWLGEIPSRWEAPRNKQLFREVDDRSESGEEVLLSVSEYYGVKPRVEAIGEGQFLSRAESFVDYKRCQKNDLAMNFMLAWKTGLGFSDYDGIVSPSYAVFRLIRDAWPRYFHYLLRSGQAVSEFKKRSYGIIDSRLRLYPDVFLTLRSTFPPIEEQRAIAEFLDRETADIDALATKKERLIELLQEKRTALITRAITKGLDPTAHTQPSGIDWLGDIPAHWAVKPVKFLASADNSGVWGKEPDECESPLPVATTAHIDPDGSLLVDEMPRRCLSPSDASYYKCRVGDIVVVKSSGSATNVISGKAGLVGKNEAGMVFSNFLLRLRPSTDTIDTRILFRFLTSSIVKERIRVMVSTTTYPNLRVGEYLRFEVPVAPLAEQRSIAEFLDRETSKLDVFVVKVNQAIERLKEFRTALISAAVTGKIDVREKVA